MYIYFYFFYLASNTLIIIAQQFGIREKNLSEQKVKYKYRYYTIMNVIIMEIISCKYKIY